MPPKQINFLTLNSHNDKNFSKLRRLLSGIFKENKTWFDCLREDAIAVAVKISDLFYQCDNIERLNFSISKIRLLSHNSQIIRCFCEKFFAHINANTNFFIIIKRYYSAEENIIKILTNSAAKILFLDEIITAQTLKRSITTEQLQELYTLNDFRIALNQLFHAKDKIEFYLDCHISKKRKKIFDDVFFNSQRGELDSVVTPSAPESEDESYQSTVSSYSSFLSQNSVDSSVSDFSTADAAGAVGGHVTLDVNVGAQNQTNKDIFNNLNSNTDIHKTQPKSIPRSRQVFNLQVLQENSDLNFSPQSPFAKTPSPDGNSSPVTFIVGSSDSEKTPIILNNQPNRFFAGSVENINPARERHTSIG